MAKKLTSSKAKQILHDKSVHGQPLTDKQKRFFGAIAGGAKSYKAETGGWMDAYDVPQAQNGIEGTMSGLTDKGFNYNPAWGGAWQHGGKKPRISRIDPNKDKDYENVFEIIDPTGISSWDDVYRSYKKTGWSPETALEILGAVPLLGNIARVTKPGIHLAKYSKFDKALFNTLPKSKSLSRIFSGASKTGRGVDAYQAYDEWQNGGTLQPPMAGAVQTVPMAQMGASLPGATGMMYARTAGAAPSEGPYAKKTMPSAQDGELLTFERKEPFRPISVEGPSALLSMDYLKSFVPEYKRLTGVPNRANDMYDRMYTDLVYKKGMDPMQGAYITSFLQENYDPFGNLKRYRPTTPETDYTEEERMESRRREKEAAERNKKVAGKLGEDYLKNGGMAYYQAGLDFKPKTISRDGSVVKDDMGYWNPDNWGKVVEIDSPYITMKGVDQDLIGVSDTGDVQYMTSGNDYVFDGESVTEYPVAKKGVSVNRADEYPLEKLDNLLNFTNYNKPKAKSGGWLDKYN